MQEPLLPRRRILKAGIVPALGLISASISSGGLKVPRERGGSLDAPVTGPYENQTIAGGLSRQPGYVRDEFIYDRAPYPSCHASTIAESGEDLVAAWFGGSGEGRPDVGIWFARHADGKWSRPVEVATGVQADGKRWPCWNPVLFQPSPGPLLLFYKVGPSPRAWWGMFMTSRDGGRTWSAARRLPDGILGPIKNKPVQLPDGTLVCGSSTESEGSPSLWQVHFELTTDLGATWTHTDPVNDGVEFAAIQPAILLLGGPWLEALGRTRQKKIFRITSKDGGHSWDAMTATPLPNPNSGIDAVTLKDRRHLIVYNHTRQGRSPLNVAVSLDGSEWKAVLVLENKGGEYSYPAVIQSRRGQVHITYTWNRLRIKHVVLDPGDLILRPMAGGNWPP